MTPNYNYRDDILSIFNGTVTARVIVMPLFSRIYLPVAFAATIVIGYGVVAVGGTYCATTFTDAPRARASLLNAFHTPCSLCDNLPHSWRSVGTGQRTAALATRGLRARRVARIYAPHLTVNGSIFIHRFTF